MIGRDRAREIAGRDVPEGVGIDDEGVRELRHGWFFPYRSTDGPAAGSRGVIVNRETGAVLPLGSVFPLERDLELYDRGYRFPLYDLVVTGIADVEGTLDTLETLGISTVEPAYEHGTVWRIPRRLTRAELRACLDRLPHVFGNLPLYFTAEALERARETGAFRFELLECRTPAQS